MRVDIRAESPYLLVDLTGSPTRLEIQALFEAMPRTLEGRAPRALIELHVDHCLDSLDTLEAISAIPQLHFPMGYRIALLITDESMRASAEFAETVAVNRGIAVRVFDRRDPALHWLGS